MLAGRTYLDGPRSSRGLMRGGRVAPSRGVLGTSRLRKTPSVAFSVTSCYRGRSYNPFQSLFRVVSRSAVAARQPRRTERPMIRLVALVKCRVVSPQHHRPGQVEECRHRGPGDRVACEYFAPGPPNTCQPNRQAPVRPRPAPPDAQAPEGAPSLEVYTWC